MTGLGSREFQLGGPAPVIKTVRTSLARFQCWRSAVINGEQVTSYSPNDGLDVGRLRSFVSWTAHMGRR